MSFLLDPPLLFAAGEAYARAPESAQGRGAAVAGAAAVGAAGGVSTALWLDASWTRPLWKALGAPSAREYQAGAPLLEVPRAVRRPGPRQHALAVAGLALYPLWFWLGWDHGRRRRP